MTLFNDEYIFTGASKNICLQIIEVLLRVAVGDLSRYKKVRDWETLNDVLPPTLLTKLVFLEEETQVAERLKTFSVNTLERGSEAATNDS